MNPFVKTLKKIAAAYNGVSLILRIAIGLVVGVILALVCPGATWLQELGNLFVGALKGIAPVLVFVIVASALAQGTSKLDRRFGTVVWLYMLTTFLAAILSVVTSTIFPQTLVFPEAAEAEVIPQGLGEVMHTLLSNIVSNPISAIMNGNYIGILMWACLFGVAMKKLGADSTKVFLSNVSDAVSTIVRWIINLAPFGIMGLVFTNVVSNGLAIFTQYGKLLLLLVGTMLFMALIINPIIIFIYLRCNPYPLVFRCLRESGLTAFFTRSSAANIPVNMAMCEKLGLDKDFYSVSIPLGATINMDGAAITITIMTLAAANTLGMQVSLPAAILLSIMSALGACGASGVAHPDGVLAVRHLERHRDAGRRRRLHHRRHSGLCRDRAQLCGRRRVRRDGRVSPVAQAGQAPAGIPRRQEGVKRQNVKTNKSAPAQRAGALFARWCRTMVGRDNFAFTLTNFVYL